MQFVRQHSYRVERNRSDNLRFREVGGRGRGGDRIFQGRSCVRKKAEKKMRRGERGGAVGGAVAKVLDRAQSAGSGVSESQGNSRGRSSIPKNKSAEDQEEGRGRRREQIARDGEVARAREEGEGEGKKQPNSIVARRGEVVSKKSFPTQLGGEGRVWWLGGVVVRYGRRKQHRHRPAWGRKLLADSTSRRYVPATWVTSEAELMPGAARPVLWRGRKGLLDRLGNPLEGTANGLWARYGLWAMGYGLPMGYGVVQYSVSCWANKRPVARGLYSVR